MRTRLIAATLLLATLGAPLAMADSTGCGKLAGLRHQQSAYPQQQQLRRRRQLQWCSHGGQQFGWNETPGLWHGQPLSL